VLAVWAMGVALLTGLGLGVEDRLAPSTLSVPGTESARGAEIIDRQFGQAAPVAILLDGPQGELERQGPALVAALERRAPGVRAISPWSGANVIDDLHPDPDTALVFAELPVREDEEGDQILARVEAAVDEAIAPPVEASLSGPVVIGEAIKQASLDATRRAELIALPVLFLVLLFVFRSPVAAAVPLLFGGATVVATRGLVALFAGALEIDATAVSAASMVGLALGVDYALLLVSRYREGLHAGLGVTEAVATARATAGRTVVFAGVVLGGAMLAPLVLAPGALLTSMAFVVMLVVVVSVVNAVVAGPALLVLLGARTERWRIGSAREPRLGGTLARALRRPGAAALAVFLLAAALATPVLGFDTGPPDVRQLPGDHPARVAFERIESEVGPGWSAPFSVVFERAGAGPITEPATLRELARWQRELADEPEVETVVGAQQLVDEARGLLQGGRRLERSRRELAEGRRGVRELADGLARAREGVRELRAGLTAAAAGGDELAAGAARARAGAEQVREGLESAASGAEAADEALAELAGGARELAAGAAATRDGAGALEAGLGELAPGASRLREGARELRRGLREGARSLRGLREPVSEAERRLEEAFALLQAATVGRLDPGYAAWTEAVARALAALSGRNPITGEPVQPPYDGAVAGLEQAAGGLREGAALAGRLATGAGELAQGAERLADGASTLAAGVEELRSGSAELAAGALELDRRAAELGQGLRALAVAAEGLAVGLGELEAGNGRLADELASGAGRTGALEVALGRAGSEVRQSAEGLRAQQRGLERLERRSPNLFDSGYLLLAGIEGAPEPDREQAAGTVALRTGGTALRMVVVPAAAPNTEEASAARELVDARADEAAAETGAEVALTGGIVDLEDYDLATTERMPLIVLGASVLAFLLLVWVLRALLLAAIAVALNLLTVAVAFGVLTFLFQVLPGAPLGGPGFTAAISAAAIFGLVFGLSIDYEVFLLGRMREEYARGGDPERAIVRGLERTAGVITGAAAIMLGVFVVFATSEVTTMREFGIGLAVAIALDATLIRLVLLPALMKIAGERAWWLPEWLDRRLPHIAE